MTDAIKLIALIKADPQLAVDYLQALDTMAESVFNRPSEPKAPLRFCAPVKVRSDSGVPRGPHHGEATIRSALTLKQAGLSLSQVQARTNIPPSSVANVFYLRTKRSRQIWSELSK